MMSTEIKTSPVKTPVKSPKSPKAGLTHQGSVPKFSANKYYLDIAVIKCPLCSEVFNSPRVLPCGHSACVGCLNNLILYTDSSRTRDFFLCPTCQRVTRPNNIALKYKWAAQFPVNGTLMRILRNASTGSISEKTYRRAFCEICLKNNWTKATHAYCGNCLEYQCETCAGHHEIAEETKSHDMTWFIPKKEPLPETPIKVQIVKPVKPEKEVVSTEQRPEGLNKNKREVFELPGRERKFQPVATIPPVVVAQTVTCSSGELGKTVVRLGHFDGKAPGDETVSEFHGIAFLTDAKVAMSDYSNKKIKVFDISHKTRVELISDIVLRANPGAICRIDANTIAVLTERAGLYHVRLLTLRDRLQHFVQKTIEGTPVGLAYISKTIVCTMKNDNCLHKYRLSRAQQLKVGTIRRDPAGNDLFTSPGVMTSIFTANGCPVLYVADETEFGVTVVATDIVGRRKSSVFFECEEARPKKKVRTADVVSATKTGRLRSRKSTRSVLKVQDLSDTITSESSEKDSKSSGQKADEKKIELTESAELGSPAKDENAQPVVSIETIETLNLDLNQTFPKAQTRKRMFPSPKGRRTERFLKSRESKKDLLNVDLNVNNGILLEGENAFPEPQEREDDATKAQPDNGLPKSAEKRSRKPERKRSAKDIGKLETIPSGEMLERPKTVPHVRKADDRKSSDNNLESQGVQTEADEVFERPKTVPQVRQKLYRADGLAVDNEGNIYVCMCSSNRVHQTTPDGRVKRDLLSEKDELLGPKAICFSPSNDVFLVACANSNKVGMFRMK